MVLAGGVLAAGCSGSGKLDTSGTGGIIGVPCGNGNPDPCVCDRPTTSTSAAEACSEKTSCESAGGTWMIGSGEWGAGGRCLGDGGILLLLDGSADAASDGGGHD